MLRSVSNIANVRIGSLPAPMNLLIGVPGLGLGIGTLVHGGELSWALLGLAVGLYGLVEPLDQLMDWSKAQGASSGAARVALVMVVLIGSLLVSLPSLFA